MYSPLLFYLIHVSVTIVTTCTCVVTIVTNLLCDIKFPLSDLEGDSGSLQGSSSQSVVSSIPISDIDQAWGMSFHLSGLLSSVCVFSDTLTQSTVQILNSYGKIIIYSGCGLLFITHLRS